MEKPKLKKICKCGKLLKAYTKKQMKHITRKHNSSTEHKKRIAEKQELTKCRKG